MTNTIKNVTGIKFTHDEERDNQFDILIVQHNDPELEGPIKIELEQGVILTMGKRQDEDNYLYDLMYRYSDSGAANPTFLYKGRTERTVVSFASRKVTSGWDVLFIGGIDIRDGFTTQEQNIRLGLQSEVFIKSRRKGQPGGYFEIIKD